MNIDRPVLGMQLGAMGQALNHLIGIQKPSIIHQTFAANELSTGTLRYRHRVSDTATAVVFRAVPRGYTAGNPGTISLAGAETATALDTRINAATGDLTSCTEVMSWVKPVTGGALTEHVFTLTGAQLHSLTAWEVPMSLLTGTDDQIDSSFADKSLKITDDVAASDPRGWTTLIGGLTTARSNMRRHLVNNAWPYAAGGAGASGITRDGNPAFEYMVGSVVGADGVRVETRDVLGSGTTQIPIRWGVYLSTHAGGAVRHTIRLVTGIGTYDLTGIGATGWYDYVGGPTAYASVGTDYFKVQIDRTDAAGGSNVVLSSWYAVEDV